MNTLNKILHIIIFYFLLCHCFTQSNNLSLYDYIDEYKDVAIQERQLYHIPASITLAQGLIESANGNSRLAKKANNHFGIKCHYEWTGKRIYADDDAENECFRVYESVEESFRDHSEFLVNQPRYSSLFSYGITDYINWSYGLQECGYATNPMYAIILISIIQKHELYQYDMESYLPEEEEVEEEKIIVERISIPKPSELLALTPYVTGNGRNIYLNNNLKCILTTHTDDITLIAQELDIKLEKLYKYNDMTFGENVDAFEVIYVEMKSNSSWKTLHEVEKGETVHSISQRFGIKTKKLIKYNFMRYDAEPAEGQLIKLSK